jgi:arginase family enzyme
VQVIGADVVEYAPPYDVGLLTQTAVNQVAFQLLCPAGDQPNAALNGAQRIVQ